MKNHLVSVAAAVPRLRVGDIDFNTKQITEMIASLPDCGLVVFPELSVTGYTGADLFQSELLLQKAQEALLQIAEATKPAGLTAVVGAPVRFGNSLYNCGAVLSQGKVKALIPKAYLPNYSEFYECRWFASGRGLNGKTVRMGGEDIPFGMDILAADDDTGAVLGVELCEDLWVPDILIRTVHGELALPGRSGCGLITGDPAAADLHVPVFRNACRCFCPGSR